MPPSRKLLIVDCAALGWSLVSRMPPQNGLVFHKAAPVFPAVTSVAQASFRTALDPSGHGMVANGLFFRDLRKILFWEQASSLVAGERIWSRLRAQGKRVGMMFWQQSLGEEVDLILSPKPVHKHGGGMIQDCYSKPHDLYDRLVAETGRPFNLMHYWGPLASRKSSDWIVAATKAVMAMPDLAPDVLFTYLPHLDYGLQRRGPDSREAARDLALLYAYLDDLRRAAETHGYDVLFFGDYEIEPVTGGAVFPNRALRDAGLFRVRQVKGMAYPDFFDGDAFAMVDHAVAHVFARDERDLRRAQEVLEGLPGVDEVMDRTRQEQAGVNHARSGDLLLVAQKGSWFAYPWWTERAEAPDFATHVDIHNKPGYDPCELFFGWPPPSVSMDTAKVRGTHGRAGPDAGIAWSTTCRFDVEPATLLDLSRATRQWMEAHIQ
ncbi:MAG: alkaline phosphatase family protein [bacterium]